jgi:hypothetical protein
MRRNLEKYGSSTCCCRLSTTETLPCAAEGVACAKDGTAGDACAVTDDASACASDDMAACVAAGGSVSGADGGQRELMCW